MPDELTEGLQQVIARHIPPDEPWTVAVAVEELGGKSRIFDVSGDTVFHPASTIKTALLVGLWDKAARKQLSLDDTLAVHNGFPSSIDGSLFDLSPDDDSEKTLYAKVGQPVALRELARLMIVRSSNLATNLLMEKVTPAEVTELLQRIGAGEMLLRNRMMDMKAFEAKQTNRATATGLRKLFAHLHHMPGPARQEMLDILLAQELNDGIPTGLPPGTRVAHKTGGITSHYHDAGIVYPTPPTLPSTASATTGPTTTPTTRPPYVLAILTRGFKQEPPVLRLVSAVTAYVHEKLAE